MNSTSSYCGEENLLLHVIIQGPRIHVSAKLKVCGDKNLILNSVTAAPIVATLTSCAGYKTASIDVAKGTIL